MAMQAVQVVTEVEQAEQGLVQATQVVPLKKNPATQLRQVVSVPEQVRQGEVQVQVLPLRTFPAIQLVQDVAVGEQLAQGLMQGVQIFPTRPYPAEQAEQLKETIEQAVQPTSHVAQTPPFGYFPTTH